jgi:hypothetical protein
MMAKHDTSDQEGVGIVDGKPNVVARDAPRWRPTTLDGSALPKSAKDDVDYRLGTPKQHCGICAMFVDPDKCTSVDGDIKREKVCDLFEPAAG